MAPPPEHHKEIARYLAGTFDTKPKVLVYRDDWGNRPLPIGEFGLATNRFYSTIGICDSALRIPKGRFELAAIGEAKWLPNALATSLYWLNDRTVDAWPMVCEDSVKQNARSTYRHMAFVPSRYELSLSVGAPVSWLLGVPLRDSEIGIDFENLWQKALAIYPKWLTL